MGIRTNVQSASTLSAPYIYPVVRMKVVGKHFFDVDEDKVSARCRGSPHAKIVVRT